MSSTPARPTAWLNRAGRNTEHVDTYVRRGVITVGWARIPGVEDLRELDDEQLRQLIGRAGRGQPRSDVRELLDFRDGMQIGDVVVTPDPQRKSVLFGEITGDYDYDPSFVTGDHRHVRTVTWLGRYLRYDLEPPLRKTLDDYMRTVLRLPNQDDWLALADSIRAGDGMPLQPRAPGRRPSAGRSTTVRSKPVGPTAPRHTPPRTCPQCLLERAPGLFDEGSEICRDCA